MKKAKKKKEKFEIPWWEDWLNADLLKREKMVSKLSIVKDIDGLKGLSKERKKKIFAQTLNGIFEDLKNAVYTKVHNEGIK